jgi:hypothetical protein
MNEPLKWLPDANETPWKNLGEAMRAGFPVPSGYIVFPSSGEEEIRAAYEQLKIREKTHFIAVRGPSHAVLNLIGPDLLIHTLRRFWTESPDSPILVQRMVHATWSGKAQRHRTNLRIKANEGMMVLDPDTYLVNSSTGKCTRQTLEPKQRKMIRHVDGSARVVERVGERTPMPAEHLSRIAELATRVESDIGWAVDDADRVWLISVGTKYS